MCAGAARAQKEQVREASGVARLGDQLLIADDSTVGRYFRLQLPRKPAGLLLLNDLDPQAVRLKQATRQLTWKASGC